ncbi:MAG: LysR family transcriptional regulator [Comamonadaceae bacterium]|nr:MAG: LysR family transcriptional regulator [Comamonadaceae bacterium]
MERYDEVSRTLLGLTPAELSTFAAVARCGGFRAAARALGTSPSAPSHSIAGLDARLFIRAARNVSLTASASD